MEGLGGREGLGVLIVDELINVLVSQSDEFLVRLEILGHCGDRASVARDRLVTIGE